jgi:hypothetical protein
MQLLEVSGAVRHIYVVRRLRVKGKIEVVTVHIIKTWQHCRSVPLFLSSSSDGGGWSDLCIALCTEREGAPDTQCVGGWVGSKIQFECAGGEKKCLIPAGN